MAKHNDFRISLTNNEKFWGWCYLLFQLLLLPSLLSAVLTILFPGFSPAVLNLTFFSVNFAAAMLLFHRFLKKAFDDLHGRVWPCVWKAALALLGCKAAVTVMNYLIWSYLPQYFTCTDMGPVLNNLNDKAIAEMAGEHFWLFTLATVFLVPPVEELLHRGTVFGSLYPKSPVLACLLSALLFAFIHVMGYLGIGDPLYLTICFLQYIPPALCLCWIYASTGSIFCPILMHMAFNAIGILSVR